MQRISEARSVRKIKTKLNKECWNLRTQLWIIWELCFRKERNRFNNKVEKCTIYNRIESNTMNKNPVRILALWPHPSDGSKDKVNHNKKQNIKAFKQVSEQNSKPWLPHFMLGLKDFIFILSCSLVFSVAYLQVIYFPSKTIFRHFVCLVKINQKAV